MTEESLETSVQRGDVRVLARGAGIALPGQVAGRVLTFGVHVALARMLGPQAFGLYAIGWTLLKVGELVAAFGMPVGVVRLGSQEWKRNPARFRGVVLEALGSSLAAGIGLGLVLYLASPWLAESVFHKPDLAPVIRLFTPGIALAAGLRVGTSATRITQRVEFAVFVQELIQPGLYLVLSVGAWALGGGLPGVVMGVLASYTLSFLVVVGFLRRLFPELAAIGAGFESAFPDLIGLSVPVSLAAIFATVTMWVDRLIVGALRPASEVGIYQAVSQASTLFAVILGGVTLVFGPMMAHLTVPKDRARMLELFRVGTKWTLYASLPVLLVVWFAAGDVIELVFGPPYSRGAAALILLTAGQILNAASGPTSPFLNMTGHHVAWFRLSGLALLVNCLLGVLLVPRWGLEGAALSTAISVGGLSLAGLVSVRRVLGAWPYDRRFLKVVVAVLATASFLGLAGLLIPAGHPFRLILMVPGAVLIFASVSVAFGLDGEDRAFLGMIRRLVTWRPEIEA